MSSDATEPNVTPDRDDVIPDTYAVYVGQEYIHVFQYRVTLAEQDGEWYFVETLHRGDAPDSRWSTRRRRRRPPRGTGFTRSPTTARWTANSDPTIDFDFDSLSDTLAASVAREYDVAVTSGD